MKILVIGSGGREYALLWKLSQSPKVEKLIVAPGNAGMKSLAELVDINITNIDGLLDLAIDKNVDLTIVGPELPLSLGIVDKFHAKGMVILGPNQFCAQLESSKAFAKNLMKESLVPTADFSVFEEASSAKKYVESLNWKNGFVIKASELAQGKGVLVCNSKKEALEAIDLLMNSQAYGVQSKTIVVEEKILGKEVSAFYLCDGEETRFLGMAQDYKTLLDNNGGPNTGGMGAYSPVSWCPPTFPQDVKEKVVLPILKAINQKGNSFRGILFVGLMVDSKNQFHVLEFNTRFGDPETQVLLPLLDEDLVDWFVAAAAGSLKGLHEELNYLPGACVHVVKAAKGYPGIKGEQIKHGDIIQFQSELPSHVYCFFAGVSSQDNTLVTSGGRVLGISARAENLIQARNLCYQNISKVHFVGEQYRKDIGQER